MAEDVGSNQPISRRQKLLGLAKATRDQYIPRLTGSVSSIASGVSSRAFGQGGTNDLYDEYGNLRFPKDTSLTLFPSYTRYEKDVYHVDVKGWLSCPGLMTRKNRLILSLARQITRYNSNSQVADQVVNQLESEKLSQDVFKPESVPPDSDTESIRTTNSGSSVGTGASSPHSNSEDLIKERLACFIARSIPNAELEVIVGPKDPQNGVFVTPYTVKTDENGHFEICLQVQYEPSFIHVKTLSVESVFAYKDILFIPSDGYGIISDIDDTIKLTGVIGDKRELMTNLLLKDVSSWKIPSVIKWYTDLFRKSRVSFHYVSNSPWQLFTTIDRYFQEAGLPAGSFHLKQYTGNIISSLMEPSSSRKKRSLAKIVSDFPKKKFICVGDSGEHDLEAYVDLALAYPNQIVAIYIRYVPDSLSDIDDSKILKEIDKLLAIKRRILKAEHSKPKEMEDLIDLNDAMTSNHPLKKLPPMVPKKPTTLKGNNVDKPSNPPQPSVQKSHTDTELSRPQEYFRSGISNPQRSASKLDDIGNVLLTQHYFDMEEMDPKGALWIRKIVCSIQDLEGTNTELRLFIDDDANFFIQSESILQAHMKPQDIL